ncbi:hypothetical protein [Nonomuraea sp. LPB2021202275-12-8]|uniref:hypothetical protein n=1 Tax=Nonomuraea sp. LPB2021202275-12-8 TaxID=3120159 RepID=UPI00300C278D
MRLWDGTEIMKSMVDHGLSQWSTMAEDLERTLSGRIAQVVEALAAAPWGDGAEGKAFKAAHFRDGGPDHMLTQCAQIAKEIPDAGDRVRKSVDNTLRTDAAMRADLEALRRAI